MYATKRLLDLAVVVSALPLVLPLCGIIGLLVLVFLGKPIFFVQERPGKYGKPFMLVKFRTMANARDANGNLLPPERRITAFGQLLRSTSLDELPEFINVIKGEMSLVGPRPLLMKYLPLYSREQMRRHAVLPGITGWAQVKGRNNLCWDEKFALDLWYVDHQSLFLDLRIIVMTIPRILKRENIGAVDLPYFTGQTGDGSYGTDDTAKTLPP